MKDDKMMTAGITDIDTFIKSNHLKLRTPEAYKKRWDKMRKEESLFDFRPEVLASYLLYNDIKDDLTEEAVKAYESGEKTWTRITDIKEAVAEFLDYMEFAWGKAEGERSISAGRSIDKLGMWLWIMNRKDLSDIIQKNSLYNPYGAPALISVCDSMGITVPKSLREFSKNKCK